MLRILIALLLFCQNLAAMNVAKRVAVIGAGASGLAAAQRLQEKGFKVTVLERNFQVGGKCLTTRCRTGHGVVDVGAIQLGIGYSLVNKYRKAVGMSLRKTWPSKSLYFESRDGVSAPVFRSLSEDFWPLKDGFAIAREARVMSSALDRFKAIQESHFVEIPEGSEFLKPFEEWANDLSLPHFKREYGIWMTAYGYGNLNRIPTYLALSLLNSSYGLIAMRKAQLELRMLEGGFGGLLSRMVDHYKLNVKTGVQITEINRASDRVTISYESEKQIRREEFGYLVIASGMESLPSLLGSSMSSIESRLVHDISHSPYDVVVAYIPELEKGGYVLPQFFNTLGHVVMVSKNSSGGEEAVLYIPRAGFQRPSYDEIERVVTKDMSQFGFNGTKILQVVYWDNYNSHFKTASSYKLLNDLQGKNRTIYIGAMAEFEIVERAMEHAHRMVNQHIIGELEPIEPAGIIGNAKNYLSAKSKESE